MNCKQCENKITLTANYCENCGAQTPPLGERIKTSWRESTDFIKRNKIAAIVISAIIVTLIVASVVINILTQFKPMEYIEVNISGFDGAGQAVVSLDYDALCTKLIGEMPNTHSEEFYQYQTKWEAIVSSITVSVNKRTQIKNGDVLLITVEITNPAELKKYGVNVNKTTFEEEYKVGEDCDPLSEALVIDIFEYLTVLFNGTNGNGSMQVYVADNTVFTSPDGALVDLSMETYASLSSGLIFNFSNKTNYQMVQLNLSQRHYLSNGDTVFLTLDSEDVEELSEFGIIITNTMKTYNVSGLSK